MNKLVGVVFINSLPVLGVPVKKDFSIVLFFSDSLCSVSIGLLSLTNFICEWGLIQLCVGGILSVFLGSLSPHLIKQFPLGV